MVLGNGTTVYYDSSGNAFDASGKPVSASTVSTSTPSTGSGGASGINLTPVGGNGSSVDPHAIPLSQFPGYNLTNGVEFIYNGNVYQVSGNYVLPNPSYPASSAQDISKFATGSAATSTSASTGLDYNASYGVDQNTWGQMSDLQKGLVVAAYAAKQSAYTTNNQQLTFADALTQAAQDPTIVQSYADAAKIDAQTFAQNIAQLQQSTNSTAQNTQQQFENDRKALAEQQASNGTAYSGFRQQAQQQLATNESGIVQSSKATLQNSLNSQTAAFEAKYGTAATTPATTQYTDPYASGNISLSGQYNPTVVPQTSTLTGATAGGITGSQVASKQSAIDTKAQSLYDLANYTPTIS